MKNNVQFQFRGEIFKHNKFKDKIISYQQEGTKQVSATKKISFFKDGPIITIEGVSLGSCFDILSKLNIPADPKFVTKKSFETIVRDLQIPDSEGIYLIDTGIRKQIITTKNLINSISKVLYDTILADKNSDMFSMRLARSKTIKMQLLSLKNSYPLAATFVGIHDSLNPNTALSDKIPNYRQYPGYFQGLKFAGNFTTLAIEMLLKQNSAPYFFKEKDLKIWNTNNYEITNKISEEEFIAFKKKIMINISAE